MKSSSYRIIQKIGAGPASTVYLVVDDRNHYYATKVYKSNKCTERDWCNFHNEAAQLSQLSHPSIVKLYQCFCNSNNNLVLVTEYCSGGTLNDYIRNVRQAISQEQIVDWLVQICLALRYLHSCRVIHRDVKSSNIFLTSDKRIKLGDFGSCRRLREDQLLLSTAGTPTHLPPELFTSGYGPSTGKCFSSKQDMWALGIVLYEMCAQQLPFRGYCLDDIIHKIKACSYRDLSSEYSVNLISLLKNLLSSNEELRPQADDILNLGFIKARIRVFIEENQSTTLMDYARQIPRFQQLLSQSPPKRSPSKMVNEGSTQIQYTPLFYHQKVCETRMFDISEANVNCEIKQTLEDLLFSKTKLNQEPYLQDEIRRQPIPTSRQPKQDITFANLPVFDSIDELKLANKFNRQNIQGKLVNSRSLSRISSHDISLNQPVICLEDD